ncbi:VOC family protein [bacterium]|nr:VOC family protein [bacterium]
MAGVTGIGGVFFKARDPEMLNQWYQEHLGLPVHPEWGCAILHWEKDPAASTGATVWKVDKQDTDWFAPSQSNFMINYRVSDLKALLARLSESGIPVLKGPDEEFNGLFAWILDPEGNKLELWEPKEPG